jgi:hypothetical protein
MSDRRSFITSTAACAGVTVLLILASGMIEASAWSNGGYSSDPTNPDYGTHDLIADRALSIATQDVTFLKTTYHARFLLGTEAPDNPAYIGDSTNHHVYYYSSGQLQDDAGAVRARQTCSEALSYMSSGDLSDAAFYIGAMAHYVSDVGVFGHTMGSGTDWGAEVHHSDYESTMQSEAPTHQLSSDTHSVPTDAYNATLQLAFKVTFGSGLIKANVWMDSQYKWSDATTFVPSAFASLDAAVGAVASSIDALISEYGSSTPTTPTTPTPTSPGSSAPDGGHATPDPFIMGLAAAALLAVSGLLVIRTRKRG